MHQTLTITLNRFREKLYDLIVSNPPFYIGSLKSPKVKKSLAKHTDVDFFETLLIGISEHLKPDGYCWLILPVPLAETVLIELAAQQASADTKGYQC